MELVGKPSECLRQRYLGKEEAQKSMTPLRPALKTGRRGAFSFYGHRLLSLYRKSNLIALTLILPYLLPSFFLNTLGVWG